MKKTIHALAAALMYGLTADPARATMLYYLPFDNGTSATLTNSGSVGGTATLAGTSQPSASTTAKLGSHSETFPMYNSNHQGGTVLLPSSTNNLRMTSTSDRITFSSWVRWNGLGATDSGVVSTMDASNTSGWALYIINATQLRFKAPRQDGNGVQSTATVPTVPTNGDWIHLAFTWAPGNASSGGVTFYVNGVAYYGGTTGSGAAMPNSNSVRLGVGANDNFGALNGRLDDTALWDTQLSQVRIKNLYNAPAVLGYGAGTLNTLWALYDSGNNEAREQFPALDKLTWRRSTALPAGHAAGDVWKDDTTGRYYLYLTATEGLRGDPPPKGTCVMIN